MSTIEVIVAGLRVAMRDREIGGLWPLVEPISRSEMLARAFFLIPLFPRPDGIGVAYDDLRDALAELQLGESFGETAAQEAAVKITALNGELEGFLREALVVSDPSWIAAAKAVPRPPTKGREEALLAEKGFSGPLLEVLVKAGGAKRHDARLQYLMQAVPDAVEAALKEEAGPSYNEFGIAGLVMHADAGGVGGHADIEGLGTARPVLLSMLCGSGRKQAQDGAAWTSAISAAAYQMLPEFTTGSHVLYRPDCGDLVAYNAFEVKIEASYRCPAAVAEALIGPRYLRAAALRAASGPVMTDRVPMGAMLSSAFQWADEAQKDERARAEARQILGW